MANIIELTDAQQRGLQKIWFVFGNNGPKHTHPNHRFIQNFLEAGEDTRDFYRNPEAIANKRKLPSGYSDGLTDECIAAVDAILKQ